RAESAEVAADLRRAVAPLAVGRCAVAGPVLRCTSPGQPEHLGELLLRVVESRLDEGASAGAP
ncbi:MAG: hypothetical protein RLO52_24480, partial [Sandaracinaceae bacterium]